MSRRRNRSYGSYRSYGSSWGGFAPYVPVAERRAKAQKEMAKLKQKGKNIQPVQLDGRTIARSFWGKGWCAHLESFSDFENRLPRGRTYIRNGSVCHLEIKAGSIEAIVSGSELYKVQIEVKSLPAAKWKSIKAKCKGQIGSMLELLQGRLSDHVMAIVSDAQNGLFPLPGEIELHCSCPDWADMCKHVAAVLYGVGSRLDAQPELLFLLRGVDAAELIAAEVALPAGDASKDVLAVEGLSAIFGIDLETPVSPGQSASEASAARSKAKHKRSEKKAKTVPSTRTSPSPGKGKRASKPARVTVFNPAAPTGEAIAQLRAMSGLSKNAFAKTVGVSPASINRWESIPGALRLQSNVLTALSGFQKRLADKNAVN